jgi:hypothetical protein
LLFRELSIRPTVCRYLLYESFDNIYWCLWAPQPFRRFRQRVIFNLAFAPIQIPYFLAHSKMALAIALCLGLLIHLVPFFWRRLAILRSFSSITWAMS